MATALTLGIPVGNAQAAAGPVTVSLTFNDGLSNQFRNARPVLRSHGVNGTFYVASNFMLSTDVKYMRFWDLDTLYREGDEVGGMGKDHKELTTTYFSDPAADLAYKTDQVCGDRAKLASLGYDPQSFTYPGGAVNATAQSIVSGCGYRSGRLVGGLSSTAAPYAEPIPPANPFALRGVNLPAGAITLTTLQNAVNAAATNGGGWLPFVFNNVCSAGAADYSACMGTSKALDASVLSSFLDWVQSAGAPSGTTVRTVRDVMGAPTPPPLPARPTAVSLTFDDGLSSQFGMRSTLAAHQDKVTFFITSAAVDNNEAGTMSWAQIHALESDGHDIGGHTRDHLDLTSSATTFDQKWHQACDDRARLVEQGFNPSAFAYPFAAFNATAESIIRGCGYQSGRTGGTISSSGPRYAESVPPNDPMAIWALGTTYDGPITLQALQDAVNGASSHGGGWVPMLFHEICYPDSANFTTCMNGYRTVSSAVLEDFLTWLDGQRSNGVSVRTMTDVMSNGSTPPPVVVTSPTAGGTVTDTTPSISGTASSTGGDVTVSVFQGSYSTGTPLTSLTASPAAGSWNVSVPTDLAYGTYTVQASQVRSGLTGTSPPVTFVVGRDTTAPTVTITKPTANAVTAASSMTVEGTAGTAEGDLGQATVELHAGSDPTGPALDQVTVAVAADGTWSGSFSGLVEGGYVLVASQADKDGNTGRSAPRSFTVDTTAPAPAITSPAEGWSAVATSVSASGTAGVGSGDAGTVTLSAYAGNATSGTPAAQATGNVGAGGAWSAQVTGLTPGDYTLVARQDDAAGNTGSSPAVHVTLKPPMTATSVTPSSIARGATGFATTLTGTNIPDGTTATVSGTGVSVTASQVVSSTTMTLTLSATATATTGARDVVLSSPGQPNVTCTGCLTVAVAPQITGVSPNRLGQGASTTTVNVNGRGFTSATQPTISGTGLTVTVASRTATQISLRVTVAGDAPVGARDVSITDPNGGASTCAGCFTVVDAPRIVSVTPATVRRGLTTTVTVTGTSFDSTVKVTGDGNGMTLGSVTYLSPTTLTMTVKLTAKAALGARTLTITSTSTKGTSTTANALTVVT